MPRSGRPTRRNSPSCLPLSSFCTSADRVRSGPLEPPRALEPWQKPHSCTWSCCPRSTAAGSPGGVSACCCAPTATARATMNAEHAEDRRDQIRCLFSADSAASAFEVLGGGGLMRHTLPKTTTCRTLPRHGSNNLEDDAPPVVQERDRRRARGWSGQERPPQAIGVALAVSEDSAARVGRGSDSRLTRASASIFSPAPPSPLLPGPTGAAARARRRRG